MGVHQLEDRVELVLFRGRSVMPRCRHELVERVRQTAQVRKLRVGSGSALSPSRLIQTPCRPSSAAGRCRGSGSRDVDVVARSAPVRSKNVSQCPCAGLYDPTVGRDDQVEGNADPLIEAMIRSRSLFERAASRHPRHAHSASARHLGEDRPLRQRAGERVDCLRAPAAREPRASPRITARYDSEGCSCLDLRLELVVALSSGSASTCRTRGRAARGCRSFQSTSVP